MNFEAEILAALQMIGQELSGIRQVLEALIPEQEAPPETTCSHPEDMRIDFGTTNGEPDWQCRLCQYRTQT